jgi:hypothetical protein
MALPERRRPTFFQKFAVMIDVGMIVTTVTLVFWFGQQVKKWDTVAERQVDQAAAIEQVQSQTAQVSGQILQMATFSNVSALEARTQVLESKQATNEQLLRELKADMTDRLRRIENKIDRAAQ